MAAENDRNTRLQKLSGSDFEVVDGQPDIRNWDVKDSNGSKLGEVDELIFDYESRKVRYLVVDIEDNDHDVEAKEVLVPIGIAELHESDDEVILPGVTATQLTALPEYNEDRFDTEHETSVRNVFGGLGGAALAGGTDSDFYDHEHFNEDNLYRNRRITTEDAQTIPLLQNKQSVTATDDDIEDADWEDETDVKNGEVLRSDVKEYDAVPVVGTPSIALEENILSHGSPARDESLLDSDEDADVDDTLPRRSEDRRGL